MADLIEQIRWERDVAIQQLKELGYGLGEKIRTDGDTISRQAAIEAFCCEGSVFVYGRDVCKAIVSRILQIPSAQPDVTDKNVGDLISRRAAIDALGDEPEVWTDEDAYAQGLNNQWHYDRNAINAVPSAQPEQRWIPCEDVLPYPGARVIVWARHTELGVETSDILRYHGEKYGWENKDICTVIAWMPLPEPYGERRTDDEG